MYSLARILSTKSGFTAAQSPQVPASAPASATAQKFLRPAASRQRILALGIAALCTLASAQAANTWTGLVDFNWDNATGNWTAPTVWVNDEDAIFGATGVGAINVAAGVSAHNLAITANGYSFTGAALTLNGSPAIDVASGLSATFSNVLSGSTGLTKTGQGTVVFTGANDYSGGTTISGGTLQIGDATVNGTIGTGTYAIASGATLHLNQGAAPASPTWANLSGAGTIRLSDASTTGFINYAALALPGTFTGTLRVDNRGRLTSSAANLGGTKNVVITNGAQFLAFTGGTSTYTQNFSIAGVGSEAGQNVGALRVSSIDATFTGGITLTANAGLYLQGNAGGVMTVPSVISGGFGLSLFNGRGTAAAITLSAANTYTGATTLSSGVTSVNTLANGGVASAIGASSNAAANLVFGGGILRYTGASTTIDRAFNLTANSGLELLAGTALTIANAVATTANGTAVLTKSGNGTLVLGGTQDNSSLLLAVSAGEVHLAKTSSGIRAVAGISSVATGTLVKLTGAGPDQIFDGSAGVNFGVNGLAGTLDLNGHTETTSNFGGAATGVVTNSATGTNVVWTVGRSNATSNFAGTIQDGAGTVALVKIGTGTQTLAGANTYTGTTSLSGGTLALDYSTQNNSKIAGALNLNSGTLQLTGATGDHVETVGSVAVNGAINLTRSGANTAQIALGDFTNRGLLNVAATGLANTTALNNGAGYLDNVTFGGNQLATNDAAVAGTLGNIAAATGVIYDDFTRLESGAKQITAPSVPGAITRLIDGTGTTPANLTIAAGTTDIDTLFQTVTGGATTVDLNGGTLRLGANGRILSAGTNSALTVQNGALTAGGAADTAGTINVVNGSTSAMAISSQITNNGTGVVGLRTVGNVTVSGATSNYTGSTTVTGGTLSVGTLAANGTASPIGAGTAVTLDRGTLQYTGGNSGSNGGANFNREITIAAGGGTIDVAGTGFLFFNGSFSGSGDLSVVDSSGDANNRQLLHQGNSPSYTGNISIGNGSTNSGWLQYRSNAAAPLGSGSITINLGGILSSDNGITSPASLANNLILNGGTLQSQAVGTNYTGSVTANAGTTSFFTVGTANIVLGGTLQGSGTIQQGGVTFSVELRGNNSGFTGTYNHTGSGATLFYNANAGSAAASWNIATGSSATARFMAAGANATYQLGALSGATGRIENLNAGAGNSTFEVGALNTSTTFAGTIINGAGGTVGLTKVGTGALTLSGVNTYTGATVVNAGTLLVTGSLTGSAVAVNTGTLGGTGNIGGALTIGNGVGSGDANLSPGTTIGTLTTGSVTFASDSRFTFEINSNTPGSTDLLTTTGTISLGLGLAALSPFDLGSTTLTNGAAFTIMHAGGGVSGNFAGLLEGSAFSIGANQFQISYAANSGQDVVLTVVPEPSAALSLLGGIATLFGLRRRRLV